MSISLTETIEGTLNDLILLQTQADDWILMNGMRNIGLDEQYRIPKSYEEQMERASQNIESLISAFDWKNINLGNNTPDTVFLHERLQTKTPKYRALSNEEIDDHRRSILEYMQSEEVKKLHKFLIDEVHMKNKDTIVHFQMNAVNINYSIARKTLVILVNLQLKKLTSDQLQLSAALNRLSTLVSAMFKD